MILYGYVSETVCMFCILYTMCICIYILVQWRTCDKLTQDAYSSQGA